MIEHAEPVPSTSTASRQTRRKKSQPTSQTSKKNNTGATRKKGTTRKWRRTEFSKKFKDRFQWREHPADTSSMSSDPVKIFEMFFDEDDIQMIVGFSITYARSKGNNTFTTSADEIRCFLGILLVSGHSPAPRFHLYWRKDSDVHNEAISDTMTKTRFQEMMRYLHVSDNAKLDPKYKLSKVRPLLCMLNERFLAFFELMKTKNLSIDESMVPYYGKHSAKQFIRGKPIRFGYKMWVLKTPLGYVIQFEPY